MSPENAILLGLVTPLAGALLAALLGRNANLRDGVNLLVALTLLFVVSRLLDPVMQGLRPAVELLEIAPGLQLRFEVEPLGMIFALVAALLWPVAALYSVGYMRGNNEAKQTRFTVCFALSLASTIGIAFAGNLLTLLVFYEALTFATYPLVTHKGDIKAMKAGRLYLGILLATSIGLLLPAVLWTWFATGTLDFVPGGILAGKLEGPLVGVLLFLFMYGIGKAAIMPVHRWLPAAMVAPTPVSALLHAVAVVKAGVFSIVKIIVYVFGIDLLNASPGVDWLLYAAGFTIVVGSVIALRQDNLKRRLAYSTVSQLSYVVLAAAILAPLSTIGAALHIVAHAFGKITLFFAAGSIYTAAHKTDVSQLDGIGYRMPWTMGAFTVGALSMIGVPPAVGFLSKWYMLMGAFEAGQAFAVLVIIASTLLNAAYYVPIIYAAWFKPQRDDAAHGEAPVQILIAMAVTSSLTILCFLFPAIPLGLAQAMMGGGG